MDSFGQHNGSVRERQERTRYDFQLAAEIYIGMNMDDRREPGCEIL
jgi:hypothetical protein